MRILLAPNRHTVIALALLKHLVLIRVQFTQSQCRRGTVGFKKQGWHEHQPHDKWSEVDETKRYCF